MTRYTTLVSLIILIALVLITVFLALSGSITAAVVKGVSMLPLLREGDMVFVIKASPSDIKIGDVIVYETPRGTLVIHRVIDIVVTNGRYYYKTQGDNNPAPDVFYFEQGIGVPYERVVGKVVEVNGFIFKIPYIGHITLMLRDSNYLCFWDK